jgi:toxin ParE1/3/4
VGRGEGPSAREGAALSLRVVLRDVAQEEFEEAFDFYEGRLRGLGVAFAAHVEKVFDRISANPKIYGVVFADVRKAVVAKFPYCVFYRPHATLVEVIAVFHSSRDPKVWQARA